MRPRSKPRGLLRTHPATLTFATVMAVYFATLIVRSVIL